MKQGKVLMYGNLAGILTEDTEGYHFTYNPDYLRLEDAEPISLTLPLTDQTYHDKILFPFFDGLIPEGWLLEIAQKNWKLNTRDRMEMLLKTCHDCIGAISLEEIKTNEN